MNQSRENQTEKSEHFSLGAFESATQKNKEVAFILDNVVDWSVLKDSIPEHVDVFVLNSSLDGLEQILSYLEIMPEKVLDAIHVLGHGSQANLNLGSISLNGENLSYYADVLEKNRSFFIGRRRFPALWLQCGTGGSRTRICRGYCADYAGGCGGL